MEIKEIKYDKINIEGLPLQIIKRDILQRQEIVLSWQGIECVENKIIDFLNHFDIPLFRCENTIQFLFPITALKILAAKSKILWPDDEKLALSIDTIIKSHCIIWKAGRFTFDITDKPLVYGILNVTPDSFYDGGQYYAPEDMKKHIANMVDSGADIIEVGGQTTKPGGYVEVKPEEEIMRTIPAIKFIHDKYPNIAIAIDTYKLPVMQAAIEAGVDIINDVRAFDSYQKRALMAKSNVGLVTMHSSREHEYDNLSDEMIKFFKDNLKTLIDAGIDLNRIILDQGIGYAKVADGYQDYTMMRNLDQLNKFNRPIMVAISRKGFGKKLFNLNKEDRLPVTLIAESAMFLRGGRVIRAHDIAETYQLVNMLDIINQSYWFR